MKKAARNSGYLMAGLLAAVLVGGSVAISGAMDHSKMDHGKMKHGKHEKQGKTMTIKGEVVDMACYLGHEAKGKKHRKCAEMCLLGGAPAGVLTDDGKLYLIVDSHSKKSKKAYKQVLKLAAKKVSLKGKLHVRDGIKSIAVEKVRTLK